MFHQTSSATMLETQQICHRTKTFSGELGSGEWDSWRFLFISRASTQWCSPSDPLVMTNSLLLKPWPMKIIDLPNLKMVIFHRYILYQRVCYGMFVGFFQSLLVILVGYMGLSENSVPLNPMVNDHYPY